MTLLILDPPAVRGERETGSKLTTPTSTGIGSELSPSPVNLGDLPAHPTASGEALAPNAVLPPKGETPAPIPQAGTLGQATG